MVYKDPSIVSPLAEVMAKSQNPQVFPSPSLAGSDLAIEQLH